MTIVRWNPMRDMMSLQNEINKVFGSAHRGTDEEYESATWSPVADVIEDNETFMLQIDMPGVDKNDVKINFKENMLMLSGERKSVEATEGTTSHREERVYGKFYRSFSFPSTVNAQKIDAKFKDGVLTITVPKAEEAKPKTIEIH